MMAEITIQIFGSTPQAWIRTVILTDSDFNGTIAKPPTLQPPVPTHTYTIMDAGDNT